MAMDMAMDMAMGGHGHGHGHGAWTWTWTWLMVMRVVHGVAFFSAYGEIRKIPAGSGVAGATLFGTSPDQGKPA